MRGAKGCRAWASVGTGASRDYSAVSSWNESPPRLPGRNGDFGGMSGGIRRGGK